MDESKATSVEMEELKKLTVIIPQIVDTIMPANEALFRAFIGAITDSYCEEHGLDAVQLLNDVITLHNEVQGLLIEIDEEDC